MSQEPMGVGRGGKRGKKRASFSRELSGTGDGINVLVVEFFRVRTGRGARIGFFLISGHLVSKGGNILVDLSCHGVFTGGLCERDSCAVLGEMGRFAGRTLQTTTGDHDWDGAFLDQIVGGGTEENAEGERG